MKIHELILLASFSASSLAFAGEQVLSAKDMKETAPEEPLFKDQEFQLGNYATYSVGNGPTHVGLFRDHAWGDDAEANFYFLRYLGIGVEYGSLYAVKSPDTNHGRFSDHQVEIYHLGGNFFFRWPIESLRLAPYAYVGGGADFEDRSWGSVYGGLGFEYRIFQHWLPKIVPERLGFFMDARWTYLGDRHFGDDDATRGNLNFFTTRAGFQVTY